jgi:hypothetical protein
VSQYPRRVLTGVTVSWDGVQWFHKAGTVVDIKPGSQLEAAYGGAGNLSAVIPPGDPARSPEAGACLSKEALATDACGVLLPDLGRPSSAKALRDRKSDAVAAVRTSASAS